VGMHYCFIQEHDLSFMNITIYRV